jgi:hypothetical protein
LVQEDFATHMENNKTKNLKEMPYKMMMFSFSVVESHNPDDRTRAFKDAPVSRRSFTGGKQVAIESYFALSHVCAFF